MSRSRRKKASVRSASLPVPDREFATSFRDTFLDGNWPLVVGHRGDPARHPDNSLAGVMSGLAAAGAVEVDVRLTGDGHLILSHDADIAGRSIFSNRAGDLLALEPRPCLLDEVMPLPGRLNLETKNIPGEDGFDPQGRMALMAASRARPSDLLTSFFWPDMDRVRKRAGHVMTGLVVGEGAPIADALLHATQNGHRVVSAHHSLIDQDVCDEAAHARTALMAWTVNRVDRADELSGMGVAAIISDDPLLICLRE